ncbi:MAG: hypothetical protein IJI51_04365 [Lachnospiraceae bacterium]|nr:hypothetical protein [Lachnospiraceae bacterium]
MMTNRQFFIKSISWSFGVLVMIAAVVAVIDPFVHFHAPFFGLAATETEERGQQIGVAKNTSYDTAIIGSSMSENFEAGWFDDGILGNNTVKLSMQGAHFDDYKRLLNVALSKPGTKRVIISLDNYLLLHNPEEHPTTIPDYLENDELSDDVYYLWNKSVVFVFLPQFLINNFTEGFSADSAYCWADRYRFDKYVARATYLPYRLMQQKDEERFDAYYGYVDEFLQQMTPYIEARPDVEFIFYSPPYSILYWDDCILRGRLTAEICAINEVYKALLEYDNVRMFYFQDDWELITDLDNYKDYSHYSKDISHYVYECMRDGVHEVTRDNSFDTLLKFSEDVADYDHESSFH